MINKFVKIEGRFLIEEFDTVQCHVKIYWVGFAYNGKNIYCLVSKHNIDGKEITRFGNRTQILCMKRSYYYKNLKVYNNYLKEKEDKEEEEDYE